MSINKIFSTKENKEIFKEKNLNYLKDELTKGKNHEALEGFDNTRFNHFMI